MRLVDVEKSDVQNGHLELVSDHELVLGPGASRASYAILSHRWLAGEVLFEDVKSNAAASKQGYQKVVGTLRQAKLDGHRYVWLDTVCIDKSSSAELSEAINSMYRWYEFSSTCYVYLSDVSASSDSADFHKQLRLSAWFTRCWTLQELLAPDCVQFYSKTWEFLGDKHKLCDIISDTTMIPKEILRNPRSMRRASVATRMSWAADRKSQRLEDVAYSLMGLFSVHMPLLYGEGARAFVRLQEEIMKFTDDYSLFAWEGCDFSMGGLLADSPRAFRETANVASYELWEDLKPFAMTSKGLSIELGCTDDGRCAILPCCPPGSEVGFVTIPIVRLDSNQYVRFGRKIGVTAASGAPRSMYFRQDRPMAEKKVPSSHKIDLSLSMRTRADALWVPHDLIGYTLNARHQWSILEDLKSGQITAPSINIPKWDPGLMVVVLFRRPLHNIDLTSESFILLLGTMDSGDLGFDASVLGRDDHLSQFTSQLYIQTHTEPRKIGVESVRADDIWQPRDFRAQFRPVQIGQTRTFYAEHGQSACGLSQNALSSRRAIDVSVLRGFGPNVLEIDIVTKE